VVGLVIWGVSSAGAGSAAAAAAAAPAAAGATSASIVFARKPAANTRFSPSQSYSRGYHNNGYYDDERSRGPYYFQSRTKVQWEKFPPV